MEEPQKLIKTEERIAEQENTLNLIRAAKQRITQLENKVVELSNDLTTAAKTISDQADLIKQLSEDNLKLVAKLDQLTGKKAPGKAHEA